MLHVYIIRFAFGDDSTLSYCYINGEFICFILEDQVREGPKVQGETAIPFGTYEAELRKVGGFHERYKKRFADDPVINHVGMIHLLDVPDFTYVQFHPGNDDDDTEGCPLTGMDPQFLKGNNFDIAGGTATEGYRAFYPPVSKNLDQGGKVLVHFKKAQVI